eukprot:EG_transcript_7080
MYLMCGVQPQQSPSPSIIPSYLPDICNAAARIEAYPYPKYLSRRNYSNSEDCQVVLQASGQGRIEVAVLSLSTDQGFDVLAVYDGPTANGTLLGNWSGNVSGGVAVRSRGRSVTVRWTSGQDGIVTGAGWVLSYKLVDQDDICLAEALIHPWWGELKTLSRGHYSNNEDCQVVLQTIGPGRIEVAVLSLSTEPGYDVLAVYDGPNGNGTLLGNWSGNVSGGVTVLSRGRSVTVRWTSGQDGIVTGTGWVLAYKLVDQDDICVADTPTLVTPTYFSSFSHGNYYSNEDCQVVLQSFFPGRIEVAVLSLFTEPGVDVLAVYEGPTANGPLLGNWSGEVSGGVAVRSRGSSVTVRWTSGQNSIFTGAGWVLAYKLVDQDDICAALTTTWVSWGPPESLSRGNYSDNEDCQTVLQADLGPGPIEVAVLSLSTAVGHDVLAVYDGPTANGTLLGNWSGNVSGSVTVRSRGSSVTVRWTSGQNGIVTGAGWVLTYKLVDQDDICLAVTPTLVLPAGPRSLSRSNYSNNEDCQVVLRSLLPGFIEVAVLSLFTERGVDVLAVYDGPTARGTLLGSWSGNVSGSVTVRSRESSVTVRWMSGQDTSVTGA